jgi:hypothetical protein
MYAMKDDGLKTTGLLGIEPSIPISAMNAWVEHMSLQVACHLSLQLCARIP